MPNQKPPVSFYMFSKAIKAYREDTKHEVTNDAIRANYAIYVKGRESPLIRRVEKYLGCKFTQLVSDGKRRDEMSSMSGRKFYITVDKPGIFQSILPSKYIKHLSKKEHIYQVVRDHDMEFAIIRCKVHGESLWRVSVGKHGRLSAKCCICQALERRFKPQERAQHVRQVYAAFKQLEHEGKIK